MSQTQSKYWCFTINNWTLDHGELLATLAESDKCTYMVVGKEIAETTGTPHLQGYIAFSKPIRQTGVRKLIPGHISKARGSPADNLKYCSKEGDFVEHGTIPDPLQSQGKRSDLQAVKDDIDAGEMTFSELEEKHFDVLVKYPRALTEYFRKKQPVPAPKTLHELTAWQAKLYLELSSPADDRTITFVVDTTGNAGKTWFAKYVLWNKPDKTQYMRSAKCSDMAYDMKQDTEILFIDCTRSKAEFISYEFMESVKDGLISSPKYESHTKVLHNNVHVVVMMNQYPLMDKLSADRYSILDLSGPGASRNNNNIQF